MFSEGESVKRKANGWFWSQQGYREESDIYIKAELEQYKEASCRHSAKTVWREHSLCVGGSSSGGGKKGKDGQGHWSS